MSGGAVPGPGPYGLPSVLPWVALCTAVGPYAGFTGLRSGLELDGGGPVRRLDGPGPG